MCDATWQYCCTARPSQDSISVFNRSQATLLSETPHTASGNLVLQQLSYSKLEPVHNPMLNWNNLLLFVLLLWYFYFITLAQSAWIPGHGRSWTLLLFICSTRNDGRCRKDLAGLCILLNILEVCLPFLLGDQVSKQGEGKERVPGRVVDGANCQSSSWSPALSRAWLGRLWEHPGQWNFPPCWMWKENITDI